MTLHTSRPLIIDAHCDTLLEVERGQRSLLERSDRGHIDLPRLREAGVTAQVFALFVPNDHAAHGATAFALRLLHHLLAAIDHAEGTLTLARTTADIRNAYDAGGVAAIVGMEGAEPLDGSIELLHIFYRLGLRLLGLTWNRRNAAADGLDCARTAGGLTPFGVQLVRECNRLGIVLDIAHLAPAGVEEVLTESAQPVIASHANARALCPAPRNLTDEQLRKLAATGGAVGVTFVPDFITEHPDDATIERLVDHIVHMLEVMGPEHVALGSDFDGFSARPPEGLESITGLPALIDAMIHRGIDDQTIKGILGENWLRVFQQTWKG
ncbi:MAG: dipeptidase [Anaerolineae bacterium]